MKLRTESHLRAALYYGAVLFSLGLIWGGGMALLRGSIGEGVAAILLGIVLQIVLKRYGWHGGDNLLGDSPPTVRERQRDTAERDSVREPRHEAIEKQPVQSQRTVQNPEGQGSDGATLTVNTGAHLRIGED